MKKLLIFATLATALLATACSSTDEEMDVSGYRLTSVEATIADAETRTSVEANSDGTMQMLWSHDDQIVVTDNSRNAVFSLSSGAESINGTFSGSLSTSATTLYGLYPASAASVSGSTATITIPTVQTYSTTSEGNIAARNVMVGESTDAKNFDFYLLGSILRFNVTISANETVSSVRMRTDDTPLAGTGKVDFATRSLAQTDSREVTLAYANPVAGASTGGWVLVAPVDLTSGGNVYFDVTTNKGTYTFCRRPTKRFNPGMAYTVTITKRPYTLVQSESELADGKYMFRSNESELTVNLVRATESNLTVGWSTNGFADNYSADIVSGTNRISLYDNNGNLVLAVRPNDDQVGSTGAVYTYDANNPTMPPRFTFGSLTPNTAYKVKVERLDSAGNVTATSNILEAATTPVDCGEVVAENAQAGDVILYQPFDKVIWGGDQVSMAAGYRWKNYSKITDIEEGIAKGDLSAASQSSIQYMRYSWENQYFRTYASTVISSGMGDWAWWRNENDPLAVSDSSTGVLSRAGYLKIGVTNVRAGIVTPQLKAIGGLAKIRVTFKACVYRSKNASTDQFKIAVSAQEGSVSSAYRFTPSQDIDSKQVTLKDELAWNTYSVELADITSATRINIHADAPSVTAESNNRFFIDEIKIEVLEMEDVQVGADEIYGYATYSDGSPASGVIMSDGFSVTKTNAEGFYKLKPISDSYYIYYTVPADCEVPVNSYGQPAFFKRYSSSTRVYNFTLTKLPGGVENEFNLFCLADPQCKNSSSHLNRLKNESVPAIKAHAESLSTPSYGITLGDVSYSEGNTNSSGNMTTLREYMGKSKIGMPVFQVMGNHDYTYFKSGSPISADATSSTYDLKAQRKFESVFGPINYSFDRGDVHIIGMRNIIWTSNENAATYSLGFTDEQYNWLKQDLSYVSKDKMVIICVHIPFTNSSNKNVQNVIAQLKQFKEAHIMSGHTHYMRNEPTKSGGIYEHIHAAVCGNWWYSNVSGDGCPNGYGVYRISGNTMKEWYFMGVNEGMNTRDYQLRLYRGNHLSGGEHEYFKRQLGSGVLLANVFNADSKWTIKVYENGTYTGNMTLISNKKYDDSKLPYNSSVSPTLVPNDSSQDWWAIGFHVGVIGRGHVGGGRTNYMTNCFHVYKYTLKNASATVRVDAVDRFGNVYTCSKITGDLDYTNVPKP